MFNVYRSPCADTFFRPPQPIAVWALASKANRQWDDIVQRTRLQLIDVLKKRKIVDLSVDAKVLLILFCKM